MRISIIAAMAENCVIGREGRLPWRLAADLRRFKRLTSGHTIVMGRKTWESIGRPLPDRRNIVVSRTADYEAAGAEVVANLEDAFAAARRAGDDEAFVIGGGEIYRQSLPLADRIYMTLVLTEVAGDATFPAVDWDRWVRIESEATAADADNEYATVFHILERSDSEIASP